MVREVIAKVMRFAYIKREENISDILAKPLSNENVIISIGWTYIDVR